jgi:hypothetical protein
MKQLIDPEVVEKVVLFFSVGGPLIGLIIGVILGAHERNAVRRIVQGILTGMLGTLVYIMWRVYGAITNSLGLDSVVNLGLQLLLFAALGVMLAFAIFRVSLLLKRIWEE